MTPTETTAVTITRHLAVPLTEKRKLELADELSTHVNLYKQLEKLKKDSGESYTKAMSSHRVAGEAIAQMIEQGAEMKPIACEQRPDIEKNKMVTYRLDTGEQCDERAMTKEEMVEVRKVKR